MSWVKDILWWPKPPPPRPPRPRGSAEGRNAVNGPGDDVPFTAGTKRGVRYSLTGCKWKPPGFVLVRLAYFPATYEGSSNQPPNRGDTSIVFFFFPPKAFYRILLRSPFQNSVRAVETLSNPAPQPHPPAWGQLTWEGTRLGCGREGCFPTENLLPLLP